MTFDFQRQIDTAAAYFLAGERCSLELKFGDYDFHTISAPTITNYAISVEIALKLIHAIDNRVEHGHDLEELYRKLPENIRRELVSLETYIADIRNYFVDWRYPYEHEYLVGEFDGPRSAFIECYLVIRRLRPNLKSIYEKNWGSFAPSWLQPLSGGAIVQPRS